MTITKEFPHYQSMFVWQEKFFSQWYCVIICWYIFILDMWINQRLYITGMSYAASPPDEVKDAILKGLSVKLVHLFS